MKAPFCVTFYPISWIKVARCEPQGSVTGPSFKVVELLHSMLFQVNGESKVTKHVTLMTTSLDEASWRVATPIVTATVRVDGQSVPTRVKLQLPKVKL